MRGDQPTIQEPKFVLSVITEERAPNPVLTISTCKTVPALYKGSVLLLQVDGQSHVMHSEEEAMGTRLTIDSLTCLMANETDPSKLLAISPGKLMRYLVPDEGHVQADQPYAEIEVPSNPPSV